MIRKRLLVTGLAMSMCLNQMPPTVLVKASQNTNSNSKFEVEVKIQKLQNMDILNLLDNLMRQILSQN